jgi:hypothetical protein
MTTIGVMRKALEALEHAEKDAADFQRINTDQTGAAITALRAEIERMEGVEPVAFVDRAELKNMSADFEPTISKSPVSKFDVPLYTAPIAPAAAGPVAWMYTSRFAGYDRFVTRFQSDLDTYKADKVWPLYTTPTPPATIPALTPEDIVAEADDGATFGEGSRWAYALAAERTGARIKEEEDA